MVNRTMVATQFKECKGSSRFLGQNKIVNVALDILIELVQLAQANLPSLASL